MRRMIQSAGCLMALVAAGPMTAIPAAAQQYAWGWPDEGGVARKTRVAPDAQPQWDASVDSAAKKAGEVRPKEPEPVKMPAAAAPAPAANSRAAQSYCENIADAAADARFLSQKAELMKLDDELARRTALLEQKTNEYKEWLGRRNEFLRKAEQSLVELYTKVKPDAAAAQIAAMDEESASALLIKLSTKKSSAILDEMPPEKAARIVAVMIGAFREQDGPASAAAVSNEGARKDAAKSASPSRQKEDKS